jgi:hypothetical protein
VPALSVGRKRAPHSCPCVGASTDVCSQCSLCLNKPDETSSPSQFRSLIFTASIYPYQSFPQCDKGPSSTASLLTLSRARCTLHAAAGAHCRVNTHSSDRSISFCRLSDTMHAGYQRDASQDSGWHVSCQCPCLNPPDSASRRSSLTWTKLWSTGKKHLIG